MKMIDIVRRAGLSRPLSSFDTIILNDFEYYTGDGTEPIWPHCMVAIELHREADGWRKARVHKYDRQQLLRMSRPPFDVGPNVLYVGYALGAEMSCHRVLGWPRPHCMLDLFAEHRAETNGIVKPSKHRKNNLLTAAEMRGVPTMNHASPTFATGPRFREFWAC
jgi:DNA polymerase I